MGHPWGNDPAQNWQHPPTQNQAPPQLPQNQSQRSNKSLVTAGVLQLVGVVGLVGFGRLYLGYTGLAIAQFIGGLFAGGALTVALNAGNWAVPVGPALVGLIDGAMILTGRVRDSQDRPLAD